MAFYSNDEIEMLTIFLNCISEVIIVVMLTGHTGVKRRIHFSELVPLLFKISLSGNSTV